MKTLLEESPDAYTRFFMIAWILKRQHHLKDGIRILDIGGSSPYLYAMLKDMGVTAQLTIVDPLPRPAEIPQEVRYFQGLSFDIPKLIGDEHFDVVLMIDVLEHIPGESNKKATVALAARFAKEAVILAGPYDDTLTDEYEERLNGINKRLFGADQPWLAEHKEFGKPNLAVVEDVLHAEQWKTVTVSTLPFDFWYTASLANLAVGVTDIIDITAVRNHNKHFNQAFKTSPQDFISPDGYRKFVIASKQSFMETQSKESTQYTQFGVEYQNICMEFLKQSKSAEAKVSDEYGQLKEWSTSEIGRLNREVEELYAKQAADASELERLRTWRQKLERNPYYRAGVKSGIIRNGKSTNKETR